MNNEICLKVILDIRKLSRFLDKYSKYLNTNYYITLPQLLCMYELGRNENLKISDLTRLVNLNNSAVTGILDRMESKDWVTRIRKGNDRRTVYLEITELGKNQLEDILSKIGEDCFFDIAALSSGELNDLDNSLKMIMNSLDKEIKNIEIE